MGLPKRKIKQVARVFSNIRALEKLFSNKERKSRLNSNFFRLRIKGKPFFVKFNRAEGSQNANLVNILKIHAQLVKQKKIQNEHYVFAPQPYIYAADAEHFGEKKIGVGVMRDMGETTLGACIHYLESDAQKRASIQEKNPNLKNFIEQKQLTLGKLQETYNEVVSNLGKVEQASYELYRRGLILNPSRVTTDLHPDNLFVIGKTKTGKIILGIIDQIEPEFSSPGIATHMKKGVERKL
jgi:hypothetical protein